jgi:hypothetical protein
MDNSMNTKYFYLSFATVQHATIFYLFAHALTFWPRRARSKKETGVKTEEGGARPPLLHGCQNPPRVAAAAWLLTSSLIKSQRQCGVI